jgi:hypothetical protein
MQNIIEWRKNDNWIIGNETHNLHYSCEVVTFAADSSNPDSGRKYHSSYSLKLRNYNLQIVHNIKNNH